MSAQPPAAAAAPTVQLPYTDKQLRACKMCHRVLTEIQFYKDGCLGCFPKGNGMLRNRTKIDDYATARFNGYVGVIDPSMSWVARVIGLGKKAPMGVYAAQVESDDDDVEDDEEGEEDDMDGGLRRRDGGGDDYDYENEFGEDGGVIDRFAANDADKNNEGGEVRAAKKSRAEVQRSSAADDDVDPYADILEGLDF